MKEYSANNYSSILGTLEHEKRKKQMQEYSTNEYSSIIGTPEHEKIKKQKKENSANRYASIIGTPEHERRKKQMRDFSSSVVQTKRNRCAKQISERIKNLDKVNKFKRQVKEGPYYICIVCNRSLYRRSVKLFVEEKYPEIEEEYFFFSNIRSFDGVEYICLTCDKKLKKKQIPCQAVCNSLKRFELPGELANLRKLEKVIISKRILFKKIFIMPKGQAPKMKGAICNVPLEAEDVSDILPRGADSNGILYVKLKRKLMYNGHKYFDSVRPYIVIRKCWSI